MAKKTKEEVLNLENILFKCRDILRQAKNSGSFFEKRDMMLTLVFLRFIGEKYEDGVVALRQRLIEEDLDPDDEEIINDIINKKPDVLVVCLGAPKQEKWISENADKLPQAALFIGLGGSLDVWSGRVRRAPRCVQKSGFEWLWRMGASPKKLKSLPKLASFGISALAKGLSNVGIMHR